MPCAAGRGQPEPAHTGRFRSGFDQSLETMLRNLDNTVLEDAVGQLSKAETIYIVARRRSYPIASYLAYALAS